MFVTRWINKGRKVTRGVHPGQSVDRGGPLNVTHSSGVFIFMYRGSSKARYEGIAQQALHIVSQCWRGT